MLGMLDEAIADLRAAAGLSRFDLSFVAATEAPDIREPLMPRPTPREAIEQTLLAARLTDSSIERVSLLATAMTTLDRDAAASRRQLGGDDQGERRRAMIDADLATDRIVPESDQQISGAGGRGAPGWPTCAASSGCSVSCRRSDKALGRETARGVARPGRRGASAARLGAAAAPGARSLAAEVRGVSEVFAAVDPQLLRLQALKPALENIKSLAGSSPAALSAIENASAQILRAVSLVLAPEDLRAAHALLVSAAQLADSAARIRREAVLSTDLARAWDASSAAAGSLMLTARARGEIETMLKPPLAAR